MLLVFVINILLNIYIFYNWCIIRCHNSSSYGCVRLILISNSLYRFCLTIWEQISPIRLQNREKQLQPGRKKKQPKPRHKDVFYLKFL